MVRPTDPAELAALRARQAANSRAYRARKAAAARGETPPPRQRKQPAATASAVERAHQARAAALAQRNKLVRSFTSARNPEVKVWTPQEPDRIPAALVPDTEGKRRQRIKVLRENTAAKRLQAVGRRRKDELRTAFGDKAADDKDPRADVIRKHLDESQMGRLRSALGKLEKLSQQTLAIFMDYEGGEGDLHSALSQIAYPGDTDVEDAIGKIESLAEHGQRAEQFYGPKAVGRLRA